MGCFEWFCSLAGTYPPFRDKQGLGLVPLLGELLDEENLSTRVEWGGGPGRMVEGPPRLTRCQGVIHYEAFILVLVPPGRQQNSLAKAGIINPGSCPPSIFSLRRWALPLNHRPKQVALSTAEKVLR